MDEISNSLLCIFGSLTGSVVAVIAISKWSAEFWIKHYFQKEKHKFDLGIESYRVKLKKSELIFLKEYEAASELVALIRSYLPTEPSQIIRQSSALSFDNTGVQIQLV
jgi:hypothetical protein